MRKLRGHKEPKEVIKVEPYEPVNRIKPNFKRDGDRKYNPPDRKNLTCYGCGDPCNKDHRKVCRAKEHTCTHCDKKGHLENCCWAKQKAGYKPNKPQNKSVKRIMGHGGHHNTSARPSDNETMTPVKMFRS